MNNMLSAEEVRNYLELSQTDLEKYLKNGKLKAYKIGGAYVRFRKEEVLLLRSELLPKKNRLAAPSLGSLAVDFWRFNNFYIVSILIVGALLYFIVKY